jgi:tRNA A37 threonylcarbamoyladenosine synthetase subunit TsaC/SUA5/YrdC
VTTVLKRKKMLNPKLNPDTSLIGVRIPDHQFVREVVRRCGQPIALTSANTSNSRSTLDVEASKIMYFMYRTLVKASPPPILGSISF